MTRTLAAAAALATLALASAASAQTWGQPVYLNAYGRPVGGTPLSEVELRSYVQTGRWADGYSDRPQVYIPAPGYGAPYTVNSYARHGYSREGYGDGRTGYARGHRSGYAGHGGHYDPQAHAGYRDEWGYSDDRPRSARRGSGDQRARAHDRDCGCGDVYLYDR